MTLARAGRTAVADYLTEWLTHVLPARGVSEATEENYAIMVRCHITLGAIRLEQLRPDDVDRMLRGLAEAGKARSTIRLSRTVLAMALTHAERRNLVARNAARLAIVPPAPTRQSRALSPNSRSQEFHPSFRRSRIAGCARPTGYRSGR